MKPIVKYLGKDGREYESISACRTADRRWKALQAIVKNFPAEVKDHNCDFANGGGYVQHSKERVLELKRAIVALAMVWHPHKIWDHPAEEIHPMSLAGRLLQESDSILYGPWSRLACIDDHWREWGQPYYASNPHEGKQVEWANVRREAGGGGVDED